MLGLLIVLLFVLVLPFTVKKIEHNLEYFLFIMGLVAVIVGNAFSTELFLHALKDPIHITLAVFIAGLLFRWFQNSLGKSIRWMTQKIPFSLFVFLVVVGLGLLSSIITAIIAALVLVLIISHMTISRKNEILLAVISCFSIGLGAALTPIGEPLSTIVVNRLDENFMYLVNLIGAYVIPGVVLLGFLAVFLVKPEKGEGLSGETEIETYKEILVRSVKIYLFVFGLTLLGAGFEPLINTYLLHLNPGILYWVNTLSAVLDNATLAAAEISPAMTTETIKMILMGLLIAGGMLIPGNIPNIISAGKLRITSKEWAKIGLPIGFSLMILYFVILIIV